MEKQHTSPGTDELRPDDPPPPREPRAEATDESAKPRRPRGFAAMDRKLVSEIARKGGKAAHTAGTAHEFTAEEAREAGRKGGFASHANRRKHLAEKSQPSTGGDKPTGG